jgi:hypothetical protein
VSQGRWGWCLHAAGQRATEEMVRWVRRGSSRQRSTGCSGGW